VAPLHLNAGKKQENWGGRGGSSGAEMANHQDVSGKEKGWLLRVGGGGKGVGEEKGNPFLGEKNQCGREGLLKGGRVDASGREKLKQFVWASQ